MSVHYVPDIILGAEDARVEKTNVIPAFMEFSFLKIIMMPDPYFAITLSKVTLRGPSGGNGSVGSIQMHSLVLALSLTLKCAIILTSDFILLN